MGRQQMSGCRGVVVVLVLVIGVGEEREGATEMIQTTDLRANVTHRHITHLRNQHLNVCHTFRHLYYQF